MISFDDFLKVDIRVGTIVQCLPFPEAKKPAYKLVIDLGALGLKKSSAQITHNYRVDKLTGKQVLCVANFPPTQVGPFISEVLVLGLSDSEGKIILVAPHTSIPNGHRLH